MKNKHNRKFVRIVQLDDAEELLNALSPTSKYFRGGPPESWIYRGVDRSDYQLVPSVLRSGVSSPPYNLDAFNDDPEDARQHVREEVELINEFYKFCNRRGLPLPENTRHMQLRLESFLDYRSTEPEWPPYDLLSLCGLAQHYGLPTRLLDWTYDARIAAYFAASRVMQFENEELNGFSVNRFKLIKMAVWAFNKEFDKQWRLRKKHDEKADPLPYDILTLPYQFNPNVHAQQGAFSLVPHRMEAPYIDRRPLDEVVSKYATDAFPEICGKFWKQHPVFVRFDLQWEQCRQLLMWLAKAGINRSTIFPDYNGVVGAVMEKAQWWGAWKNLEKR